MGHPDKSKSTTRAVNWRSHGKETSIANSDETIQRLRDQLASSERDNRSLRAEHDNTRNQLGMTVRMVADLEKSAQGLRDQLATANFEEEEKLRHTIQSLRAREENSTNQFIETIRSLRADLDAQKTSSERTTAGLEETVQGLTNQLAASQCARRVHEQKYQCETLFAHGHIYDAAHHLLDIIDNMSKDLQDDKLIMDWIEGFRNQCISRLQAIGDEASNMEKYVEAFSAHSAVLSLTSSPPHTALIGWARMGLRCHSADEVLGGADKFMFPKIHLYRAVCDVLEEEDRITEAIECFQKMKNNLLEGTDTLDDRSQCEHRN